MLQDRRIHCLLIMNSTALTTVDRDMRRRYVFRRLDSDLVVRGMVYNKTDEGLIIALNRVPFQSFAFGDGEESQFDAPCA